MGDEEQWGSVSRLIDSRRLVLETETGERGWNLVCWSKRGIVLERIVRFVKFWRKFWGIRIKDDRWKERRSWKKNERNSWKYFQVGNLTMLDK